MRFLKSCLSLAVACFLVWGLAGCSRRSSESASREVVQQLLQQEAESLKRDGEQVDPSLDVKIIWEIQSVEVRERAEDEAQPWEGTIRFLISSEVEQYNGTTEAQSFEREFDYVWEASTERWVIN